MPAAETLSTLVLKGSAELGLKLLEDYAKKHIYESQKSIEKIRTNVTPHINAIFNKCSSIKTLLNPQRPANFLEIYATQRFIVDGNMLDQYGMVDRIRGNSKNTIITGTGGSGKSMFTRYLWLSLFVFSGGKIPLFIELRSINNLSTFNINTYIRQNISAGEARITESDYNLYMRRGDFIIILDGFDEIVEEKKEQVQRDIIFLSENYPETRFIITSRPEPSRFSSWPLFEVAEVAPLTKPDVVELIKKAEFSEDSKKLFLIRLKTGDLFSKHKSFMVNPLLASMMLLTFSQNYDIPDSTNLFYQQAFDALYQRHDSYKPGGYKREFKTGLSENNFKRVVSQFCLITYRDSELSFTRDTVLSYLDRAIKLTSISVDPSLFLDDLCNCVCFLILDGIYYTFSHRSFQEYFTAYCLASVTKKRFVPLVQEFGQRINDEVIPLLIEMDPESFRRLYVLYYADQFGEKLQLGRAKKDFDRYYEDLGCRFRMQIMKTVTRRGQSAAGEECGVFLHERSDMFNFVGICERLNGKVFEGATKRLRQDVTFVDEVIKASGSDRSGVVEVSRKEGRYIFSVNTVNKRGKEVGEHLVQGDNFDSSFRKTWLCEYLLKQLKSAESYIMKEREIDNLIEQEMNAIFP